MMELKVGDRDPKFYGNRYKWNDFDIQNYVGKKPLVTFIRKIIHLDVPHKHVVLGTSTKILKIGGRSDMGLA
jgi:hypothetical protein